LKKLPTEGRKARVVRREKVVRFENPFRAFKRNVKERPKLALNTFWEKKKGGPFLLTPLFSCAILVPKRGLTRVMVSL